MNVSSVTSGRTPYTNPYQTNFRQGLQDFESLANALQSGNLSSAQSAFSSLGQDLPGMSQLLQASSSSESSATQNSPIVKDLQSLQSALQSGDLSGAQKAFANLQQSLQQTGGLPRGHRHHHGAGTNGTHSTNSASQAQSTDADGDSDGSSSAVPNPSAAQSHLNVQA